MIGFCNQGRLQTGYLRVWAGTWLIQHIPKYSEEGTENGMLNFTDHTHSSTGNKGRRTAAMAQPTIHTAHSLFYHSRPNQKARQDRSQGKHFLCSHSSSSRPPIIRSSGTSRAGGGPQEISLPRTCPLLPLIHPPKPTSTFRSDNLWF